MNNAEHEEYENLMETFLNDREKQVRNIIKTYKAGQGDLMPDYEVPQRKRCEKCPICIANGPGNKFGKTTGYCGSWLSWSDMFFVL